MPFFEVPSADLSSKACFLEPFWILMGSKIEPLGGTFASNGSQSGTPPVDPKHPGADYFQTANFMLDVGRIWAHSAGFGMHLGALWGKILGYFGNILRQFAIICASTSPTFSTNFEANVEPLHR